MFVSRPELALLQKTLDDVVTTGAGTTLFVTGEPGIGKSTLIRQFLDGCDGRYDTNILTATGRCLDIDGISRGYLPWKEILIELGDDAAVAQAVGNTGNVYAAMRNNEQALECFRLTESSCRRRGDRKGLTMAVGAIGRTHSALGEYDLALECYRQQREIARELGDRLRVAEAEGNMGTVLRNQGDLDQALECYQRQEALLLESGNRRRLARVYLDMAIVLATRGDQVQALQSFRRQGDISRELGDREGLALSLGNMGIVHRMRGEFDQALECYRQVEEIAREADDLRMLAVTIGNRGSVHVDIGDYAEALKCFQEAGDAHRAIQFPHGLTYWLAGTVEVLIAVVNDAETGSSTEMPRFLNTYVPEGDKTRWRTHVLEHARTIAEECVAISEQLSKPDTLNGARIFLAEIDAAEGNVDEAILSLLSIVREVDDPGTRAKAHYHLWQFGDNHADHRAAALEIYQSLAEHSPNLVYRKQIEDLTAGT